MNMNMNNGFLLESDKCNGAATCLSELNLYHYVYIMQTRAQEPVFEITFPLLTGHYFSLAFFI